jgi:hypothetical protein
MPLEKDSRGKLYLAPDSKEPPATAEILLAGEFSLVTYTHDDGKKETRLVLVGREPENRKLVLEAHGNFDDDKPWGFWRLVLDMPGGSRSD